MTPDELLEAWHRQQTAFIEFRELRTRMMTDALQRLREQRGRPLRMLDLACGPASLASAALAVLPDGEAVAVDCDPVLLRLARETNRFGDRLRVVEADLTAPDLPERLPAGPYDAAFSATALHWLDPDELVALYQRLPRLLGPGALFMNADHLFYDARHNPWLSAHAPDAREAFEREAVAGGVMGWDQWWAAATGMPGWEQEAAEREKVWADDHPTVKVSLEFHLAALRAAGFTETGQLYQLLDDRIVFARLPDPGEDGGLG
ncbi:class I SAM-dependent methyltransferase [Propionibacterium australiense]|uniref:Methyltransferase domain n=1 Tax=Propionibacterium australiense TaxID=119981 RepID=A0A383S8I4_9ACTN|nr:class I SAM-dependent methyltransferase [Propionibacterium australiense]RLP07640.1 methyltransferase domain-containing protein [Propionibacterium australiense]RLP08065.1 methyltransferase domain-containing protein [Propionibacterium australiense]SYZ33734.1 Methyltransferase domain [Propionibacterium australiense]VEH92782.1 trans-aconitate 2-methyltransferase [Propionibacterium australiense]